MIHLEDQGGSGFETAPARHYAGYHAALNLGVNSSSFADHPGRIVVQRQLGNDFEFADGARMRSPHGLDGYQALMQRGSTRLERSDPNRFELISRNGKWSLYSVTQ